MSIVAVRISLASAPEKEHVSHVMAEEMLQMPERFMEHARRCSKELLESEGILTYQDSDGDACTLTTETVHDAVCFLQGEEMPSLNLIFKPAAPSPAAPEPCEKRAKLSASCATAGCPFLAHPSPNFKGFCCHGCRSRGLDAGDQRHGPRCQRQMNTGDQGEHDDWSHGKAGKGFGFLKGLGKAFAKALGKGKMHGKGAHFEVICDGCEASPIVGIRYRCTSKDNFDLCERCYQQQGSPADFEAIEPAKGDWCKGKGKGKWHGGNEQDWHAWKQEWKAWKGACKGAWKGKGWGKGWGKGDVFDLGGVSSEVVHENVTCDGCGASPLCGIRFKSLDWDDYDLCRSCHDREDREAALGVAAAHQFQQIPEVAAGASDEGERVKGLLAFVQSCGVDVQRLLPRLAAACLSLHADEDLTPLLEQLTAISQMEQLSIDEASEKLLAILSTVRGLQWWTQKQIFKQAGWAVHQLLAESGVDAELFKGASSHCGWWNRHMLKMFKGMKGKGKCHWWQPTVACDGCGACPLEQHFRSQSWSNYDLCHACFHSPDKEQRFGITSDHPFVEMTLGQPASASSQVPASSQGSVCEDALAALLSSENEAVRSAAERALAQAKAEQADDQAPTEAQLPASETLAELVGDPSVELLSAIEFDASPVGDVSQDWAAVLADFPKMRKAYHFGRVRCGGAANAALTIRLCVVNTSQDVWPEETALRIAAGPAQGLPELKVGALAPGDVAELQLQLQPQVAGRSTWSLESHGEPFGPLLIFDTEF